MQVACGTLLSLYLSPCWYSIILRNEGVLVILSAYWEVSHMMVTGKNIAYLISFDDEV